MAQGKPAEMIERYRAEMEEAGIWQPQLFPYTWEDVQDHPSHPLAKQLQQTLQQRRTATLHADTTDNHTPDIIVTEQLEIGYRQKSVMSDMNISIQSGKWVAIVGANGSGKSTFLKSLIRLERIRSGQLSFQHKLLKKWSDRDLYEQAGFVFQNPELQFVTDTVFDEIAFGGRQRNWSEEEVTSKTIQLLQEFGLEAYQDQHPFTLSLGQKRRLSVATMLLFDQSLLLLDEPTFGQDAKTSAELIKRLQQRQEQGTTIVMVTHDMDLVDEYADTVILFDQGKVIYNGAPYHLFANPEHIGDHAIIPPLHYRLLQPQKERSIV
ncbi:energy-coupling factor transporter ATP-binding protein EcfA2 [Paenibacillus sp. SORGH_AS338]|nr:energy-coupling factor transporter ATP-binding protein EcfA2 [Paenibacillus sp. SORGH_AS_0338]